MTRIELVRKIAKKSNQDEKIVENILMLAANEIAEQVAAGYTVTLRKFGYFIPKLRQGKNAYLFKNGNRIQVPAKYIPFFKPSKNFKNKVEKLKV